MENIEENVKKFSKMATAVSSTVVAVESLADAAEYALRLCSEKVFSRPASAGAHSGRRVLAAPGMPESVFAQLAASGEAAGVEVVAGGLRGRMDGIDVGFTLADMGIAETGTVVMRCYDEEPRLASMICETHVVVFPQSRIVATSYDAEAFLCEAMAAPMYTAFISGCSRTSDIERVLTLGVHGPLELHIVLTGEA